MITSEEFEKIKLLADEIVERFLKEDKDQFRLACACATVVGALIGLRSRGIGDLKHGYELISTLIYSTALETLAKKPS